MLETRVAVTGQNVNRFRGAPDHRPDIHAQEFCVAFQRYTSLLSKLTSLFQLPSFSRRRRWRIYSSLWYTVHKFVQALARCSQLYIHYVYIVLQILLIKLERSTPKTHVLAETLRVVSTPLPASLLGAGTDARASFSALSAGVGAGACSGALNSTLWTGGVFPAPFVGDSFSLVQYLHQSSALLYGKVNLLKTSLFPNHKTIVF